MLDAAKDLGRVHRCLILTNQPQNVTNGATKAAFCQFRRLQIACVDHSSLRVLASTETVLLWQ